MPAYADYDMYPAGCGPVDGNTITIEEIQGLRREAAVAGDEKMVATCDLALSADFAARCRCAEAIREGRGAWPFPL